MMRRSNLPQRQLIHGRVLRVGLIATASSGFLGASSAAAQDPTPLARVQELGLDTVRVGRVTAYFTSADRDRAVELATLAESAAAFFERELGLSFELRVAALSPERWFSEFPGVPYAIPWVSMPDRLLFVASSLTEGFMVRGPTTLHDRYRIDFGLLHEYAHIAENDYLRSGTDRPYPTPWLGELLANVIAYAYVHSNHPQWAEEATAMWRSVVEGYIPPVLSLDWSFMNELSPQELAQTYAWYQNLLNLRAAALYEAHGLAFLQSLKRQLSWNEIESWTADSVVAALEDLSPGFAAWTDDLTNPKYLARDPH
jgi:hypothetical protein